jgi:MFS family permease
MHTQGYKRYVTVLLLVAYILNQLDRAIFSILMEPIKAEFALSDTQLGFLAGPALLFFYAFLGIPVARLADRSHRINIMSLAIGLWSLIVTASAAVTNFWQFALARVGVGVGEAGFSAVAQSVIADYHQPSERTRALAIFMLALPLGPAISSLMGGWINETYGWRAAFLVAGLPGILLALLIKLTVREPQRSQSALIQEAPLSLRAVLVAVWRRRALRHMIMAMMLMTVVTGGILGGWSAPFFIRVHHMSTGELGTWLAFNSAVGGGAGVVLSGIIGSRLKLSGERTQARLLVGCAALAWPLLVAMLLLPAKIPALLFALAVLIVLNFFFAPSFALVQGLSESRMRATVVAIVIFFQILFAGVVGLQLTGILSDAFSPRFGPESVRWAMLAMSPAALWAAGHFWMAARAIEQDALAGRPGNEPAIQQTGTASVARASYSQPRT